MILQEELLYQVQQKKSSWEVSIAQTRSFLAKAKKNLQQAMRSADLALVIQFHNEIKGYESGLEIATAAFAELFPE